MAFFSRFLPKSRRYMYKFIRDRDCSFPFLRTRIGKKSSLFPLFFCLFFEITPVYLQKKSKKIVNDGIKMSKNWQKLDIPGWSWFWMFFRHTGVISKKSQKTRKNMRFFVLFSFFVDIPGWKVIYHFFRFFLKIYRGDFKKQAKKKWKKWTFFSYSSA